MNREGIRINPKRLQEKQGRIKQPEQRRDLAKLDNLKQYKIETSPL